MGRSGRDSFLIGSELIVVVVIGHPLKGGHWLIDAETSSPILRRLRGHRQARDRRRFDRHRSSLVQLPVNQSRHRQASGRGCGP